MLLWAIRATIFKLDGSLTLSFLRIHKRRFFTLSEVIKKHNNVSLICHKLTMLIIQVMRERNFYKSNKK